LPWAMPTLLFEEAHGLHRKIIFRQGPLHDFRVGSAGVIGDHSRMIHRIRFDLQHAIYFVEDRTYPQGGAFSVAARNNKLDHAHMFRQVVIGYTGEKANRQKDRKNSTISHKSSPFVEIDDHAVVPLWMIRFSGIFTHHR